MLTYADVCWSKRLHTDMQISRKESREKALSMKDAAKKATQISPLQELCQSW